MERTSSVISLFLPGGSLARQLLRALAIALIAMSLLAEAGAAKPYSIGNASQQGFVNACRENGGTTKRLSTRVVECTLPNGYVIVCNFNSGLCIDYPPSEVISVENPGSNGSRSLIDAEASRILPALPPSRTVQPAS